MHLVEFRWSKGLLALLVVTSFLLPSCAPGPSESGDELVLDQIADQTVDQTIEQPNIIVYLVDTLRADHLGTYGYDRPTSPHLDAFAAQATVFEDAVAQSPWTRPSVVSLLTGVSPLVHGVNQRRDLMSDELVSISEILTTEGYATAGFVANPNVRRHFGLAQGFDTYQFLKGANRNDPFALNKLVTAWLDDSGDADSGVADSRAERAPILLYVHAVAPHGPYDPPREWRDRFVGPEVPRHLSTRKFMKTLAKLGPTDSRELVRGQLLDLYDAEIARNDQAFGEFLQILQERGRLENSLVVFLSDHGEEFDEHGGWEHGRTLFQEVLSIPLVVRFPGQTVGQRSAELAQHIDFVPTVLSLLGREVPSALQGRPWSEEDVDRGSDSSVHVFSYLDVDGRLGESVLSSKWKFIRTRDRNDRLFDQLFDREQDPSEQREILGSSRADHMGHLLEEKRRLSRAALDGGEAVLTDELEEQLRELGYIDD